MLQYGLVYLVCCGGSYNSRHVLPSKSIKFTVDARNRIQRVARLLKSRNPTAIHTDCDSCALETAYIISKKLNVQIHVWPGLSEIDCGLWAGCNLFDMLDENTYTAQLYHREGAEFIFPCGESLSDAAIRVKRAVKATLDADPFGRPVVIGHPGINALALISISDGNLLDYSQIDQPAGCINILRRFKSSWRVQRVGILPKKDRVCCSWID